MRGFDFDFWFAAIVLAALMFFVISITKIFKLNFVIVFLGVSAIAWMVLNIWEKQLLRKQPESPLEIYCEWENRINELDFNPSQASTISDLQDHGLTLEQAVGKSFIFHTEPNLQTPDLYFEGSILKNKQGKIVIRSNKPLPQE